MSTTISSATAGLASLSGFSFQIKVFIYLLCKLNAGEQIEFETLDDITVKKIPNDNNQSDYCIKSYTDNSRSTTVFQVKQATVSLTNSRKVLYNWLLALNTTKDVAAFKLYVEKGYSVDETPFTNGDANEFKTMIDSQLKSTALVSQVKKLYEKDFAAFQHDYQTIVSNYQIVYVDSIEQIVFRELNTVLHLDASSIGGTYAQMRVEEVFTRICSAIMSCASTRQSYITGRPEFLQICEDICRNISPEKFSPDYKAFAQLHSPVVMSKDILDSREYQQLNHCKLDMQRIQDYLIREQYYMNIRQHYLADAQGNLIDNIEDIAHQNHLNVVTELQLDGMDTPPKRLIKTMKESISYLPHEHSRWGSYIFLTNRNAQKQISWKDDNDEE